MGADSAKGGPATVSRLRARIGGKLSSLRATPWLSRDVLRELLVERRGGHVAAADDRTHLKAAISWLERAQDATHDDGFARGYSMRWDPYFRLRGWQPSYPETTGYIIPTLYQAARVLRQPALASRAERAARWLISIRLPEGAIQGGVIGQAESPAVFNTGQAIFGWLSALEETGDPVFADAAVSAGSFLVKTLDDDGVWRKGSSTFAHRDSTLYNARTAWALAEAGTRLEKAEFLSAATRALQTVAERQHASGWIPDCCLNKPDQPLLHTLAYALRGLLEGGRILEDDSLISGAKLGASHLASTVAPNGWMPGRYAASWRGTTDWSCLTGQAQIASVWMRLHALTGEREWLEPVPPVLSYLKATQDRFTSNPGVRGGIRGSMPVSGAYGQYQVLNWATKFFADALIRCERTTRALSSMRPNEFCLA